MMAPIYLSSFTSNRSTYRPLQEGARKVRRGKGAGNQNASHSGSEGGRNWGERRLTPQCHPRAFPKHLPQGRCWGNAR